MSTRLAAALALLICLAGIPLIRRDFTDGKSQLWLGGKPIDVTRVADPMLFWTAVIGKAALLTSLMTACVAILLMKQ